MANFIPLFSIFAVLYQLLILIISGTIRNGNQRVIAPITISLQGCRTTALAQMLFDLVND